VTIDGEAVLVDVDAPAWFDDRPTLPCPRLAPPAND
jgi:hypothetical protein